MASIRLQPPSPFDFKNPDAWPRWKRRFEQFRQASGLASEDDEKQISTLLYCMGEDAEETLLSTKISEADRKKYSEVIGKFDAFYQVRKNVIFERARFNRRCQEPEESVEQFITSLYDLAENCSYGDLKDQMIRDRIVVGIRDRSLSERLQLDPELTLEKAKTLVRQREAVQEHQAILRGQPKHELAVDSVEHRPPTKRNYRQPLDKCSRCGRGPHPRQSCPARDAICRKCKKRGHFQLQCLTKTVAEVAETNTGLTQDTTSADSAYDMSYLDVVSTGESGTSWSTTVTVNGYEMPFKLDTGAEVTVISDKALEMLNEKKLQSSMKRLCGPDKQPLEVVGELRATLVYKGRSSTQPVYVVRNLQQSLLGLPAIQALNLLTPVDAVGGIPIPDQYPEVFAGLGTFPSTYQIKLKPDSRPLMLFTPRNVPLPLRKKVQEELKRMESLGVISKVNRATQWCSGMVVVPKQSGSVRICVDFRRLNESVMRETYPLPKVDITLAQLAGATIFSKIDANSGFWQIPLEESSRELTTFITPFGRYYFNRLPFGIASAPEHFQQQMETILSGLDGILCHMDDVLIFGTNQEEHDTRLQEALRRIRSAGVTLNKDKCEFGKTRLTFLGHVIDCHGVSPDPKKTSAVASMAKPKTRTELRRFLGMTNQLGKFNPHIAEISQPLRELLSSKRMWLWGPSQDEAFEKLKLELTQTTILALYDPEATLKISADASAFGLGAVLLQQRVSPEWRPVAYASRAMSDTEQRYSQIEKEALAIVWACERFSDYIVGKPVKLETDHKPLVPLLATTHLDRMPPRILRFRLRLTRFLYSIEHVPGKYLCTADALSRAPEKPERLPQEYPDTEFMVRAMVTYLPAGKDRLDSYREAQKKDPVCSEIIQYCKSGWPKKHQLKSHLVEYWRVRGEISLCDDLLLYNMRIVIPKAEQAETLRKIHQGHQGIQKCRQRVSAAVWWPGVGREVEKFIKSCPDCQRETTPPREPLLQSSLPSYPWERVGTDMFELNGSTYLLVVDYYSRYVEVQKLRSTTSVRVIEMLKSVFARHGVPAIVVSDNGPQYASGEMREFAESYGFSHITSSPHYPQANGEAERAVKTVKGLLKNSADPYMALLSYRATPLPWCGLSPAELLMGRRLRTDVPQLTKQFVPNWSYLDDFHTADKKLKESQKQNYDKRHRVRELPILPDGSPVWVDSQDGQIPGEITQRAAPRSYYVETRTGEVRRNRSHLRVRHDDPETLIQSETSTSRPHVIETRSRTGTTIRPPDRFSQ